MNRSSIYKNLENQKKDAIDRHLSLVMEKNKVLNLTAIRDLEDAKVLHLEDSLCGLPELESAPEGIYMDLGSGGGFPGVPLAIASGRDTVLIESVKKKAKALEEFCEALGLSTQIKVEAGRIEELTSKYRETASVLTARALSSIPSLLELASPLLKDTGLLILFKSGNYNVELERASQINSKLGFSDPECHNYNLSDGSARSLILFQKNGKAQLNLPRRTGIAQKKPLA
ncbi:MAG: 16S rRNA (guanine(527)-N(7))-methyltransferase RsmG [Enterococcus sp.]|nr:16S rRNA (guanine(527)-N(7))-methyltransferase RsmG [Enterococcus sp.]